MASLRELRRRIKSVDGIRQITRAMQLVSATKLMRAQQRIEAARPYTDKMDEILMHLSAAIEPGKAYHPLMEPREEVKRLMIVGIASDKGLCGSFNSRIIREVEVHARRAAESDMHVVLLLIGRKLNDFFRRRSWEIHPESLNYRHIDPGLAVDFLQKLTNLCADCFLNGEADKIDLVYTEFRSPVHHIVRTRDFLPVVGLRPDSAEGPEYEDFEPAGDYIFEPEPEKLFGILIPKYARIVVFRALAESIASEQGSRMNSMRNATDNAEDMIRTLTLHRNKARQAAITKELAEIVGGAEALRG